MADCVERLLRVGPIADLPRLLESLACVWGQACQLDCCCIELLESPAVRGSDDPAAVKWSPHGGTALVRFGACGQEESGGPEERNGRSLPLHHNGTLLAQVSGAPIENLWAVPREWRDVTAWLIAQALAFRHEILRQKLQAMAEFAAGAGHEINNPLGTIIGRTQQLLSGESDPQRRRWLQTIGAQTYRIRDMIGDTMLFARPPEPQVHTVDLNEHILAVTARFADDFHQRKIALFCTTSVRDKQSPLLVRADPTQLDIVASELIRNALAAVPDGSGKITVAVCACQRQGDTWARWSISDNGPGLSPTDRDHLFDPFYSGRQAGRGLGFGLSKCWRIVQQHGGSLCAAPSAEGGLQMTVLWPAATEAERALGR